MRDWLRVMIWVKYWAVLVGIGVAGAVVVTIAWVMV